MAYLIDTDIFIDAKNRYYGMDFCPAFWDWLVSANGARRLLSIRAVWGDLTVGEDRLAEWARTREDGFFVPPTERDLSALGQVAQYINDHQIYTPAAKQGFLACSDYFVVAQALAGGHTVVTHEKPENSINRIKIPSVCVALQISYMNPWQMLRTEHARFVLQKGAKSAASDFELR
jgi:hypothetical protein